MNIDNFTEIALIVGIPIENLHPQTMSTINNAPHAQLRTSSYKKAVFIVDDLVYKGPYTSDDLRLKNNLIFTYAIQLLEEALKLPEWQRGTLPWKYIGQWGSEYYLAAPNVGKWKDIPFDRVSSKIETDVPIVPRGGSVWRVSDVEKNGRLNDRIVQAALQHLYFRFLLYIGDSGTHNILIREDYKTRGRLIAGIDLEEKRAIRTKDCRLDHLFKQVPSRRQVYLYQTEVCKIKSLSYRQFDQQTLDSLGTVGIDLERLKVNMELWDSMN